MRRFFVIISGVVVLIFNQCTNPGRESETSYFDGVWQAEWYLLDEAMHSLVSESEITMNGQVVFKEDQSVEITAYGFEGCVFAADTARNLLTFDYQDSLLNLINKEKEVVFSYQVKEKLPQKLTLLLLDDIQLTLTR